MKAYSSNPLRATQPLSPAALLHIAALAEVDEGLAQRCARYRRRTDLRRSLVATCLCILVAVGTFSVYSLPPRYTEIVSCCSLDEDHICETIETALNRI